VLVITGINYHLMTLIDISG